MKIRHSILSFSLRITACVAALAVFCFCLAIGEKAVAKTAEPRVVHVVVALCDNKYQGIVPVPAKIGNGQDPGNNLYWGAAHGVKTFFRKQPEWELLEQIATPAPYVLERLIFRLKGTEVYMVADAFDGQYIKEAIRVFLRYSAGTGVETVNCSPKKTGRDAAGQPVPGVTLNAGGQADLVVYIGHNGLMDFSVEGIMARLSGMRAAGASAGGTLAPSRSVSPQTPPGRPVAVFACMSEQYFSEPLDAVGAVPLVLTTN